ncbi:MAG TPA: AbrB/MazE/SpoVT family DNA-binding domain-containing protein [Chloroflexota bacterium]|jgi:AbrB family looped-hinge helix DNA binding protein|nr:AbrB/MazE/SpoVT family DNA-binding domain-containing protein [Chloroflexota bacterium]
MYAIKSVVTRKGQVTIPIEFRKRLGIHEGDSVEFTLEEGALRLRPIRSRVDESFQAVPPLSRKLTWKEIEQTAQEEHAQEAAREGLRR